MPAEDIVRSYLAALEEREIARAEAMLAPGHVSVFPGGARLSGPREVVAWAAPRYRWVRKRIERVDAAGDTVYVLGTLYGEWPDGSAFEGIRFIDRFELRDGRIARIDVWNDLAEVRAAARAPQPAGG